MIVLRLSHNFANQLMELLSIQSHLIGQNHWLELPDGRAMKYDLKSIRIDLDYVHRQAFAIAREQIGVVQENPDHATLRYCQPPAIKGNSWQEECWMTAKEDVLFRGLVRPEFAAAFLDALSTPQSVRRSEPEKSDYSHPST